MERFIRERWQRNFRRKRKALRDLVKEPIKHAFFARRFWDILRSILTVNLSVGYVRQRPHCPVLWGNFYIVTVPFPNYPPAPSRTFKRPMNTPLSYVVHTLEVLAIHPPRTEERRRLLLPPLIPLLNTNPSASSCITKLKINHKAIKVKRSFESIVSALLS